MSSYCDECIFSHVNLEGFVIVGEGMEEEITKSVIFTENENLLSFLYL